jgi:hypothetical protein
MSNGTVNRLREPVGKEGRLIRLPVKASTHLYEGYLVAQASSGSMLVPGSSASSGHAIGVATHESDNSSGADADLRNEIETERVFIFDNATAGDACSEATPLGAPVFMVDNHTLANNDAAGTLKRGGFYMGLEPDGRVRVLVVPLQMGIAADIGALTLSALAGTANQTAQAIPDPTDTPASADALRDDLVANALPPIRNNLADLYTQINLLRTNMQAAGLML